jgi:uncharacterized protein YjbI with pentapeptide repeats
MPPDIDSETPDSNELNVHLNLLDIVSNELENNTVQLDMQNKEAIVNAAIAKSKATGQPIDLSNQDLGNLDLSDKSKFPDLNLKKAILQNTDFSGAILPPPEMFEGAKLSDTNLSNQNLSKFDFRGRDLSYINLSGAILPPADMFEGAQLFCANLSNTDLSKFDFRNRDLNRINLSGATLPPPEMFEGANLLCANLSNQDLSKFDFRNRDLSHINLSGATLPPPEMFEGANLLCANLSNTDLSKFDFRNRDLDHVNFSGAILPPPEMFEVANLSDTNLSNTDLSKFDFRNRNLSYINFSGAILPPPKMFNGAILRSTNLSNTDLSKFDFRNQDLRFVDLSDAILPPPKMFNGAQLSEVNLSNTDLSKFDFRNRNLNHVNFSGAILPRPKMFKEANLLCANLSNTDLSIFDFRNRDLGGVNFSGAILPPPEMFKGANLSNANLSGQDLSKFDFRNRDLNHVNFSGAILPPPEMFKGANLSNANLSGQDLSKFDFRNRNLNYINFYGAILPLPEMFEGANLFGANLSDHDLSGYNLTNCDLRETSLYGTILDGALIDDAKFSGTDLSAFNCLAHKTVWGAYLGAHLPHNLPDTLSEQLHLLNSNKPLQRWQIVAANITWHQANQTTSDISSDTTQKRNDLFLNKYKELCDKGPKQVLQLTDNLHDAIHCLNHKVIPPHYAKLLTALANQLVTPDSNGKTPIPPEKITDYIKQINPGAFRDAHRHLFTSFDKSFKDADYSNIVYHAKHAPEAMYALKVTNLFGNNWRQWIDFHEQKKITELIEGNPQLKEELTIFPQDNEIANIGNKNNELKAEIQKIDDTFKPQRDEIETLKQQNAITQDEYDARKKEIKQQAEIAKQPYSKPLKENNDKIRELQLARESELQTKYAELRTRYPATFSQAHHDACIWLPVGSQQQLAGLGDYLLRHSDHNITDLEIIAKNWKDLKPEQKELSFEALVKELKKNEYPNAKFAEFAHEAAKWGISQEEYPEMERRFLISQSVSSPFPLDKTWSVTGENGNTYTGRFLPRTDARGIFLGQHSASCQHPKGVSAQAAWYGQERPNSGFFVVENEKGEIIAQSWAWVSDDGGLCFDNVEAKELGNRKKPVREIYQLAAQDLSSEYHTITLGTVMSKVDVSDLPEAAQLDEADPNKVKALELPSDFMAERAGVMQGGWADSFDKETGKAAQVVLACNSELPKLNSPPYPTWVAAGIDKDKEALKKIVEACYPKGFQWVDGGEHILLKSREGGIIGYAAIDTERRYIGDLAVMPEHRQHSKLLIDALANYLQQHDADKEWSLDSRPSTSYILLRRAEKDGLITITNDTASSTQLPPEDMTDREKRNLERALGRLGVPEDQRNNMRRITFRAAVPEEKLQFSQQQLKPLAKKTVPPQTNITETLPIAEIAQSNILVITPLPEMISPVKSVIVADGIKIDQTPKPTEHITRGSMKAKFSHPENSHRPAAEQLNTRLAESKISPKNSSGRALLFLIGFSAALKTIKRALAPEQPQEHNTYKYIIDTSSSK